MRPATLSLLLGAAALAGFLALAHLRDSLHRVSGDEGTFLAMAASLALDRDLTFGPADRARLEAAPSEEEKAVILQRTARGLSYSKPSLYPLLAAPFHLAFGGAGLVVFNAIALALALWLAFAILRRRGPAGEAALTVVTFAGASVVLPYVLWRMSDALQVALALAGLAVAAAVGRGSRAEGGRLDRFLACPWAPALAGAALGALTALRYPNGLVAAAGLRALALARRRRALLLAASGAAAAFIVSTAINWGLTGVAVPYKAERASFDEETGYPAGAGAEQALRQFEEGRATHSLGLAPQLEPAASAYAALYFLVGRHTGLLLYFPAALVLAGSLVRHPDAAGRALLLGAAALALFYLVWMPRNYFGGEGFIGNRYFLMGYPALLAGLPAPLRARRLVAAWAVSLVAFGSAALSVTRTRSIDRSSQNHASAGVCRLLPYESVAPAIDGRRDRYWSHEFVRFVDPYAQVGEWSFRLPAGGPPAELQVASKRRQGVLRFVVHSSAPEIAVVYRDWRRRRSYRLASSVGGADGLLEIESSAPWKRHPFWWNADDPFLVRAFRLAIRTPDGRPATTELRYLGPYHVPSRIFEREVLATALPAEASAGTVSRVAVQVRNRSPRYWTSEQVLPVYLSYRLLPGPGLDGPPIEGVRTPLPGRVRPGAVLDGAIEVRWPDRPGEYTLVVDLVLEGVAWFADKTGSPLAEARVAVGGPEIGSEPGPADSPP